MTKNNPSVLTALGIMSGTSLDGLDLSLLRSDGDAHIEVLNEASFAFPNNLRQSLRVCQGSLERTPSVQEAEATYSDFVIACVQNFLATNTRPDYIGWPPDYIGLHGQTIAHAPEKCRTVQLGDAQALAQASCIATVYDFRSNDVENGGQGAPLAPIYHRAVARHANLPPAMFVNIGGVANITYCDPQASEDQLIAFDCGPGNALMDDVLNDATGEDYDADGKIAASGNIDSALLQRWQGLPYFTTAYPKSLHREDFHDILQDFPPDASLADKLAVLAAFTAWAIGRAAESLPTAPEKLILCGGGRHNRFLCDNLNTYINAEITAIDDIGFDGDMLEAQAFAYCAIRHVHGLALSFPLTTGAPRPLTGGKLITP